MTTSSDIANSSTRNSPTLLSSSETSRCRSGILNDTSRCTYRAVPGHRLAAECEPESALCRSHSAAVWEVGAVEGETMTTTNWIFMGTQRVHTSLASGRSGPTLTVTRRPVNSGLPLIANADQRPLMRPPEAGAQVRILSGAPCRGHCRGHPLSGAPAVGGRRPVSQFVPCLTVQRDGSELASIMLEHPLPHAQPRRRSRWSDLI